MQRRRHVIFDLGQVLIAWDPVLAFIDRLGSREAALGWMARIAFDDWNRLQDGGRSFAEGLAAARAEHGALADPLEGYADRFARTIEQRVPGSWEIAEALLARDVGLYAITNWAAETWPAALALHPRLGQVFRDILVSGHVGMLKPDPAIYRLLMDRNLLHPAECLFIDDNPDNVAAARALGIDAIAFEGAGPLWDALAARGLLAG